MWNYEKRLQYPVKITQTNPKIAQVIITQFGGPDGELAASMRYLSQRYTMPYKEVTGILTDIGTEELAHMEMICAIVHQLTRIFPSCITPTITQGRSLDIPSDHRPDNASSVPAHPDHPGSAATTKPMCRIPSCQLGTYKSCIAHMLRSRPAQVSRSFIMKYNFFFRKQCLLRCRIFSLIFNKPTKMHQIQFFPVFVLMLLIEKKTLLPNSKQIYKTISVLYLLILFSAHRGKQLDILYATHQYFPFLHTDHPVILFRLYIMPLIV